MDLLREGLLVAAAQGALLCAVLLSLPSGNRRANKLLVLYVGLESLHLFYLYLVFLAENLPPSPTLRLAFGLRYLDGPLLYFYVTALTRPRFELSRKQCIHASVLLAWIVWFGWMISTPGWETLSTQQLQLLPSTMLASTLHSVILFSYILLSLKILKQHRSRVEQALSGLDHVSLDWLRALLVCMLAVCVLHMACDAFRLLGWMSAEVKAMINLVVTSLLIYLISIGGMRQPQIFTAEVKTALQGVHESFQSAAARTAPHTNSEKYAKSGLDLNRRKDLWRKIEELLSGSEPYLDPTLDLPKLAILVESKSQDVSETINQEYGGSFYDLINFYRVEAAKTLLSDPLARKRKLLDIALSVGFTSQSTFYDRFKKITGLTPAKFRAKHQRDGTLKLGEEIPAKH